MCFFSLLGDGSNEYGLVRGLDAAMMEIFSCLSRVKVLINAIERKEHSLRRFLLTVLSPRVKNKKKAGADEKDGRLINLLPSNSWWLLMTFVDNLKTEGSICRHRIKKTKKTFACLKCLEPEKTPHYSLSFTLSDSETEITSLQKAQNTNR